jgi:carotenoid cleavage dioxygenase
MEVRFPDIPLFQGWGRPLRVESSIDALEVVDGRVPDGLDGTWYRAGPDWQYPSLHRDQVFIDGEGMAHMLRFAGGTASYRSRWVHTPRFLAQQRAGRSLFGRYRNRYTDAPEAAGINGGTANTSMIFHAGRLLCLKEDDLPYEMDMDTLETGERTDLGGQVGAVSLSAHPKLDAHTGEMLTYSFQARGACSREFVIYAFDAQGRKVQEIAFEAPWSGVVHDFGVTEEHFIVPFFPLITTLETLKAGGSFYEWHDDKPVHVAVVPRRGTAADIRWFKGPTASAGHMMNAFTEGAQVHLDVVLYDGNCFPFFLTPDGRSCASPPPQLTRLTCDLASEGDVYSLRTLCTQPGEMPRTDDRYQGRRYRHGFMIMYRAQDGTSSFGRVDVDSGALDYWAHDQRISVQEPQFVPRSADAPEGDGWLLVILNRLDQGHSEIGIFDAQRVAAGPVARLHLPVRVRSTFHGNWVPAAVLDVARATRSTR